MVEINGYLCKIHKVQPYDILSRLSIRYIVDENLIKRINGLANDEIHLKEKVYIPIRKVKEGNTTFEEEKKEEVEEEKKETIIPT